MSPLRDSISKMGAQSGANVQVPEACEVPLPFGALRRDSSRSTPSTATSGPEPEQSLKLQEPCWLAPSMSPSLSGSWDLSQSPYEQQSAQYRARKSSSLDTWVSMTSHPSYGLASMSESTGPDAEQGLLSQDAGTYGSASEETNLRRCEWLTRGMVEQGGITSLMLHGLPAECSKDLLLRRLNQTGFRGMFDYVHVPFDLTMFTTKGYAFINMTTVEAAAALVDMWTGQSLMAEANDAQQHVMSFTAAAQQGLEAQVKEMLKSKLLHIRNPHLRPFLAKPWKMVSAKRSTR